MRSGAADVMSFELVELAQDLDGLPAQLPVEAAEVLVAELARSAVGRGVADLAVLGLLAGFQLGAFGFGRVRLVSPCRAAQRDGDENRDEGEQDEGEEELHGRWKARRARVGG